MKVLSALTALFLFGSCLLVNGADPLCSGVPTGEIYLFPYPGDCSRYYECENGVKTPHNCSGGYWFNEALQACDHPDNSGCTPLVCPPNTVDFYPFPDDCTKYVECYQGSPETHTCPDGLWFNAAEKRCVSVEQSACGNYSSTNEPTWTVPVDQTCYGVLPGYIELKPFPGDCRRFIECIGAASTVIYCPSPFYFDYARQMCIQPELSGCDDTTGTPDPYSTTPAVPGTTPQSYDDPRCANGNNDYWPDVECSRFIECYLGHGYVLDCPSGLHFHETNKRCEDPSVANCGITTVHIETTTPDGWNPDPDCPWPSTDRYLFPFPGDCTKFLECYIGIKTVQDCPADLWFNPTLLVCDYPYHAGCAWATMLEE